MSKLIMITDDFWVDPIEISSLEKYEHYINDSSPSGGSYLDHAGTIVVQKCGRKTYLKGLKPSDVMGAIDKAAMP